VEAAAFTVSEERTSRLK